MDVKLRYNPFFCTTKLCIDGVAYRNTSSRLYTYLNMPIEKWIENNNESYKSWDGFFVELVDELNDDMITFTFLSDEKYFDVILKSFEKQKQGIEQKGFHADEITISFQNVYESDHLKEHICNFVKRHLKSCKTQLYMEKVSYIYKDCQNLTTNSSDYYSLYERIIALLEYGRSKAIDKDYWNDSIAEITKIYDGKETKNEYSSGSNKPGK